MVQCKEFPKGLKLPQKRALKMPSKNVATRVEQPSVDKKEWYYQTVDGEEMGPFKKEELKQMIKPSTLVWKAGMDDWTRAMNTEVFNTNLPTPAPTPKKSPALQISDKWAWYLAVVPLVAFMGLSIILDAIGTFNASIVIWVPTIVCIFLNFIFTNNDTNHLHEHGQEGPSSFLGTLLVPGYLFMRSAKITKQFAPAFLWCFLFLLSCFVINDVAQRAQVRDVIRMIQNQKDASQSPDFDIKW